MYLEMEEEKIGVLNGAYKTGNTCDGCPKQSSCRCGNMVYDEVTMQKTPLYKKYTILDGEPKSEYTTEEILQIKNFGKCGTTYVRYHKLEKRTHF
jgi:hypothetical protein